MPISMKAARVDANMTQDKMAKALGIAIVTYQHYEQGKTIPKMNTALQFARIVGRSVNDINFF